MAGWLLVLAALAAPWIGGAQTTLPNVRWWLGGALVFAFFLDLIDRLIAGRRLAISWSVGASALFLLGCLGWWATQPEPHFSTLFGGEHWEFLKQRYPRSIFQWPRIERLGFLACIVLGFLATVDLGRREIFRRQLTLAIGVCGMVFALYALGFAWLGFPALPWVLIDGGTERFNVCFAHYSGPPAMLNLAWPLLVFGATMRPAMLRWIAVVVLATAAMPLWDSAAGKSIAAGLLAAGAGWMWAAKRGWMTPGRVCTAVAAAFLVVFAGQWFVISQTQSRTPDHWVSAANSLIHAASNDARLRELSGQRDDHLIASPASDRPVGWLSAFRMALDYPLIGPGPGAWVKRSALYTNDPFVNTFYLQRQYAHHDLLQFAAEWGGLATLAVLFLFLGGLLHGTSRNLVNPTADAGIVLALTGIALHSTVDFPLQNPALQLWTALLLGLAWSRSKIGAS